MGTRDEAMQRVGHRGREYPLRCHRWAWGDQWLHMSSRFRVDDSDDSPVGGGGTGAGFRIRRMVRVRFRVAGIGLGLCTAGSGLAQGTPSLGAR